MIASKTIMVLGGGIGGLVTANKLRQYLPGQHRIILVEKNDQHAFAPSFPWLMTGNRRHEQISRPIRQMVGPDIAVINTEARRIDITGRCVETEKQRLNYDYLVIALGAELAPEIIPGLAGAAHIFYTLDGATRLQDALDAFTGGTLAIVVSALPYKCPGAPHEASMLIDDLFRKRGIRGKVDLRLFTPEPQPMPVGGPKLGEAVRHMLEAKGINFHPLHKLTAVNAQAHELLFEGKESIRYDLLVAIPPHRGSQLIREAGLANEAGWIPVDRSTLSTQHEDVYAIGDVTAIPIPGRWKPDVPLMLPKAGVFAHAHAQVVAHRIAAGIRGTAIKETFHGEGYCILEAGGGQAGFAFGNFFAEPSPQIQLKDAGRIWHLGKVLFEQWWLSPSGPRREAMRLALSLSAKALGIPVVL